MKSKTVEKWVWPLVYGGLLALVAGLAVARRDESIGWTIVAAGGAVAALGAALIFVRSRMPGDPE